MVSLSLLYAMIIFHQGKAFTRIKAIYIIEKKEIASFPSVFENEISEAIPETFEELKFIPNTGLLNISPRQGVHGTHYEVSITCQLNKNEKDRTNALDKYKFKELITIVTDFDNNKTLIGGESSEKFSKMTFGLNLGNSNNYPVNITSQMADFPPYYTNTIVVE